MPDDRTTTDALLQELASRLEPKHYDVLAVIAAKLSNAYAALLAETVAEIVDNARRTTDWRS